MRFRSAIFVLLVVWNAVLALPGYAQENSKGVEFKIRAHTVSPTIIKHKDTLVQLWGVEAIEGTSPQFNLQARMSLDNFMNAQPVLCAAKAKSSTKILAQCENAEGLDMGLHVLQEGYAVVDRSLVYDTPFEDIYLGAEQEAQRQGKGVWQGEDAANSLLRYSNIINLFMMAIFVIFMILFIVIALLVIRGFKHVVKAQEDNVDMVSRERRILNKERKVIAAMLESELKENLSRIEAYILVYEENFNDLHSTADEPRYKKMGDIIQKQPSLSRSVYDKNTDKLNLVGKELSSALIHFYARVKSNPDYQTIEPTEEIGYVKSVVEDILSNAKHLKQILLNIIVKFEEADFSLENAEEE